MTRAATLLPSLLMAALVGGGCPAKPPVVRPYPPPAVDTLRAVVAARHVAVRSMNARARATSWISGERLRATVLMLVQRAGNLRFEAEVSLQGTVSILTTSGARFGLLDLQRGELHRGPACPENVASLIRIPLLPSEVAAMLLGDVQLDAADPAEVQWDGEQGTDVLAVTHNNGTRTLLAFRRQGQADQLVGVTREGSKGRLWRVSFEEMENVGGLSLPSLIRFAEGKQSFDDGVEIKFKDRTLNQPIDPADFTVMPSPGTKVIEVGCGAP